MPHYDEHRAAGKAADEADPRPLSRLQRLFLAATQCSPSCGRIAGHKGGHSLHSTQAHAAADRRTDLR